MELMLFKNYNYQHALIHHVAHRHQLYHNYTLTPSMPGQSMAVR